MYNRIPEMHLERFQSQNGLILTSEIGHVHEEILNLFQSQNGLILTLGRGKGDFMEDGFQSQNGLILTNNN